MGPMERPSDFNDLNSGFSNPLLSKDSFFVGVVTGTRFTWEKTFCGRRAVLGKEAVC